MLVTASQTTAAATGGYYFLDTLWKYSQKVPPITTAFVLLVVTNEWCYDYPTSVLLSLTAGNKVWGIHLISKPNITRGMYLRHSSIQTGKITRQRPSPEDSTNVILKRRILEHCFTECSLHILCTSWIYCAKGTISIYCITMNRGCPDISRPFDNVSKYDYVETQ